MSYSVDYSGEHPDQTNIVTGEYPPQAIRYIEVPRKGFAIPAILKTTTAFCLGAAALFSAEMWGPDWLRPSTPMGHYEQKIEGDVKAAELRVQAQYEPWAAEVKASAEQKVEQYRAQNQLLLKWYEGSMGFAKMYAESTVRFQTQVAAAQMDRTRAEQSGEIGFVSMSRVFGHLINAAEEGAGNGVLDWSQQRSDEMAEELQRAAENGVRVKVEGWNANLPDPAVVQMQMMNIQPLHVPPPPTIQHHSDK